MLASARQGAGPARLVYARPFVKHSHRFAGRGKGRVRRTIRSLPLFAAAVLAVAAPQAHGEAPIGGVIQRNFNGAQGTRVDTSTESLLFRRDVFLGELVSTPPGGSTVVRLNDKTQLQLGSNSSVVLDRFVYDPQGEVSQGTIRFSKGVFRFIGGDVKSEQGLKLRTPTASLTIRGTKLIIYVAENGSTTVGVIQGAIEVAPCGGNRAGLLAGQAGQVATACKGLAQVAISSLPQDPAIDTDYVLSEQQDHETPGIGSQQSSASPGGSSASASATAGAAVSGIGAAAAGASAQAAAAGNGGSPQGSTGSSTSKAAIGNANAHAAAGANVGGGAGSKRAR
jgi:hypothetical protein